jgi:hypothetical protein
MFALPPLRSSTVQRSKPVFVKIKLSPLANVKVFQSYSGSGYSDSTGTLNSSLYFGS